MKYSLILFIATTLFAGCSKELSLENGKPADPVGPVEPAKEISRKYQLKAFYSDIPIDFVETDDVIKSETDLWSYVKEYIKDDINELFNDSTLLRIYQNEIKIPGNDAPVLEKYYRIGTDAEGKYMKYMGPEYELLHYRLLEFNDDYFIIYLKWRHGSTIYSRFDRVR